LCVEKDNPTNAAFSKELADLINDLQRRFKAYINNDLLIVSSLLDPRYTRQIEELKGHPFAYFVEEIISFTQFWTESNAEENTENVQQEEAQTSQASTNLGISFWDEPPTNQNTNEHIGQRNNIEVTFG
jgi:hypothetical protein